jgi:hypothetical protein
MTNTDDPSPPPDRSRTATSPGGNGNGSGNGFSLVRPPDYSGLPGYEDGQTVSLENADFEKEAASAALTAAVNVKKELGGTIETLESFLSGGEEDLATALQSLSSTYDSGRLSLLSADGVSEPGHDLRAAGMRVVNNTLNSLTRIQRGLHGISALDVAGVRKLEKQLKNIKFPKSFSPSPPNGLELAFLPDNIHDIESAIVRYNKLQVELWKGFRLGTVGGIYGPGGSSKSYLLLQLGFAYAAWEACQTFQDSYKGVCDTLDLELQSGGRVLYLAGEDDIEDVGFRLQRIVNLAFHASAPDGTDLTLNQVQKDSIFEAVKKNLLIPEIGGPATFEIARIGADDEINYCLTEFLIKEKIGLVILDPVAQFHGENENDNHDIKRLIQALQDIARTSGASILFSGHVSKDATFNADQKGGSQHAARGASAWTDNLRWAANMFRMTDKEAEDLGLDPAMNAPEFFVKFSVVKHNHGALAKPRWFTRGIGGELTPSTGLSPRRKA